MWLCGVKTLKSVGLKVVKAKLKLLPPKREVGSNCPPPSLLLPPISAYYNVYIMSSRIFN